MSGIFINNESLFLVSRVNGLKMQNTVCCIQFFSILSRSFILVGSTLPLLETYLSVDLLLCVEGGLGGGGHVSVLQGEVRGAWMCF